MSIVSVDMMMVEFCLVFIGFIALTTDFINYGIKHPIPEITLRGNIIGRVFMLPHSRFFVLSLKLKDLFIHLVRQYKCYRQCFEQ
jgi:hypothetical protein